MMAIPNQLAQSTWAIVTAILEYDWIVVNYVVLAFAIDTKR